MAKQAKRSLFRKPLASLVKQAKRSFFSNPQKDIDCHDLTSSNLAMTNKSVDCFFVASLLLSNDGVIDCHENPYGSSHNDGFSDCFVVSKATTSQ